MRRFLPLFFFAAVFLLQAKSVSSQGVVYCYSSSFGCAADDLTEPPDGNGCDPGYVPLNGTTSATCSGVADPNGVCTTTQVPCITPTPMGGPTSVPTPTPDSSTACGATGRFCRTSCAWNEVNVAIACNAGSVCCEPVNTNLIQYCSSQGGSCADTCLPTTEFEWTAINWCQQAGQKCCLQLSNAPQSNTPFYCDSGGNPTTAVTGIVFTAIGCVPLEVISFSQTIIQWAIGISGGIAFILILFAAFQIASAGADTKRIQSGRDLLFSALAGLVLISLGVVMLNFIGVDVLGLNSLGFNL